MMLLDVIRRWRGHLPQAELERIEAKVRVLRRARAARRATAGYAGMRLHLYQQRVAKAAGIADLTVVCHADTLSAIEGIGAVRRTRWIPLDHGDIEELPDEMVRARFSAAQVTCLLFALAGISGAIPSVRWGHGIDPVMCRRLYDLFGAAIDQTDPTAGKDTATLVINDHAAAVLDPA